MYTLFTTSPILLPLFFASPSFLPLPFSQSLSSRSGILIQRGLCTPPDPSLSSSTATGRPWRRGEADHHRANRSMAPSAPSSLSAIQGGEPGAEWAVIHPVTSTSHLSIVPTAAQPFTAEQPAGNCLTFSPQSGMFWK